MWKLAQINRTQVLRSHLTLIWSINLHPVWTGMINSWCGFQEESPLIDKMINLWMIKLKNGQLTTCSVPKELCKMDWSLKPQDFYSVDLNLPMRLSILTPISTEFKLMRIAFSFINPSMPNTLLDGVIQTSLWWLSGLHMLLPMPNSFFCHLWFHFYSLQEDGPSRDISLGTQSWFLTLSK